MPFYDSDKLLGGLGVWRLHILLNASFGRIWHFGIHSFIVFIMHILSIMIRSFLDFLDAHLIYPATTRSAIHTGTRLELTELCICAVHECPGIHYLVSPLFSIYDPIHPSEIGP